MIASHRFPMYEPDENHVDLDYLLYFFKSKRGKYLLELASPGGAGRNKTLGQENFATISIPLPNISRQREVAKILSTWDQAIILTEKLLAEKQLRRKGLMQQLMTGKRRLPGFNEKWKTVRLKDIFERIQQTIPEGETPEVLSITSTKGFVSQKEKFKKVIAGKNLNKYILIKKGEFSYNKGNSKTYPQGCVFQLKEYDEGAVPNVFYSFRAISEKVYPEFYSHIFASGGLNHQLSRVINTGVRNDGLLNLRANDFFNIEIVLPSIEEQRLITSYLDYCYEEIDLLTDTLSALKEQKKGLMQQLLTGKTRVKLS